MQVSSQGPCSAWPWVTTCASHGSPQRHPGTVQNSPFTFLGDAGALVRAMALAMLSTHLKIECGVKTRAILLLMKEVKFEGREKCGSNQLQVQMHASVLLSEEFS